MNFDPVKRSMSKDEFFMLHAHLWATRSTCDRGPELLLDPGRHGVGSVIVKDGRIIASGYNGSPPGEPHCNEIRCAACGTKHTEKQANIQGWTCNVCDDGGLIEGGHVMVDGHCQRTLHAEENAILQCALDGTSPVGGTIYTTASPCYDCAKRLIRVGISRLVYASRYESRYGLSDSAREMLERQNVKVENIQDILN